MKKNNLKTFNFILITTFIVLYSTISNAQKTDYELFWQDEFNGSQLDLTKWQHRGLGTRRGGTVVEEAAKVDGNGNLIITTTILDSNNYYVGMIGTGNTFNTTYGYFEARVKFGKKLNWDSFWLQCPTAYQAGPTSETGAEVDICEYYGAVLRTVSGWDDSLNAIWDTLGFKVNHNVHWADDNGIMTSWGARSSIIPDPSDYVILAVEWTENRYYFYVNDSLTYDTGKGISGVDEYIILSVEPYYWDDLPDSIRNGATVQDTFFIDYVRVYKNKLTNTENSFSKILKSFTLEQNYPNPFNPATNIKYTIPALETSTQTPIQLLVYNVLGKKVATLVNEEQSPGNYEVIFNAKELPNGIYFYRIMTDKFSKTRKMILMK